MRLFGPAIFGVMLAAACSSNGAFDVGKDCTSDSDCGDARCVDVSVPGDAGCVTQKQCFYPCTTDSDCAGKKFGSFDTPICSNGGAGGCPLLTPTCTSAP